MAVPRNTIDFQSFVDGLSTKFLQCRARGHGPWRDSTAAWVPKEKVYDCRLRCGNCGATRPQFLDKDGYIIKMFHGGYTYPKGYLAIDVELPSVAEQRAAYRLAHVRRLITDGVPRKRRLRSVS